MANDLTFSKQMVQMKGEYGRVLPAEFGADRMERMVLNALSRAKRRDGSNPLLEANRQSFWSAVMTAASLALPCDGVLGHGYLLPFKGQVAFVPGYAGYITLAARSNYLVQGYVVHEADEFEYEYGLNPHCKHRPAALGDKRGPLVATYATARSGVLPGTFHVSEKEEILRARQKSAGYLNAIKKGKDDSPWQTDFLAMARKTSIRALSRQMPLGVQQLGVLEDAFDRGNIMHVDPESRELQDGVLDVKCDVIEGEAERIDREINDGLIG